MQVYQRKIMKYRKSYSFKTLLYVIILIINLLLAGCYYSKIITPPALLNENPQEIPKITLRLDDIDVSGLESPLRKSNEAKDPGFHHTLTKFRNDFKKDLYNSILKQSTGTVSSEKGLPYCLFLKSDYLENGNYNIGAAVLNTFFPFLVFIPRSLDQQCRTEYTIKDSNNRILCDKIISDSVDGIYNGVNFGMNIALNDLTKDQATFLSENASTLILNDIYTNVPKIIQAEREKEQAILTSEQLKKEKARAAAQTEKDQKARQWNKARSQAEDAMGNNDFKKAVAILEKARNKGIGGKEAEQMLRDIFQTPEWQALTPKISIQRFDVSSSLDPSVGDFLYDSLIAELTESRRFTVVDWEELGRMLDYVSKSQPNVSIEDAKKQAMNQLGVTQLYVGSAYKIGSKIYVTVKALNLDLTVDTTYKETAKSMDDLEPCISKIADKFIFSEN
jgi:hypothetical protein